MLKHFIQIFSIFFWKIVFKIWKYKCCFIGDSINDALCAEKANVKLILLRHGYSFHNLNKLKADYVLSNLKNVSSKICKLLL